MSDRLRRWLPSRESLERNRWLRWLGPALGHPRLWHLSRRGVALGVALGVFFGLLIPIAQIPMSVGLAVVLRANVPVAAASTLVTNPFTFGPVYYAAWHLGTAILGEDTPSGSTPGAPPGSADGQASTGSQAPVTNPAGAEPTAADGRSWWARSVGALLGVGKPLLLGLAILACALGLITYLIISWIWTLKVRWTRRRRLAEARPADIGRPG